VLGDDVVVEEDDDEHEDLVVDVLHLGEEVFNEGELVAVGEVDDGVVECVVEQGQT
jgi:hypothetical protein